MSAVSRVMVAGRELELTNLEKRLWPEYTKADYLDYLTRVAPFILPHLEARPLVVTRYPDGIAGEWFYQKDCPDYAPPWIETYPYWSKDSRRTIRFIVCGDLPTLIWLGNQACIEFHPWLSGIREPSRPDFAVIDLDPAAPATFEQAREVAHMVKEALGLLGLRASLKTSGATGIHIYVPAAPRYSYKDTAGFVRALGERFLRLRPDLITLERSVGKRSGKVYVDYLQNVLGKTIVAPYSTRPHPGAPVSMPFTWEELDTIDPREFTLGSVPGLLSRRRSTGDTSRWLAERQSLDAALAALGVTYYSKLDGRHPRTH